MEEHTKQGNYNVKKNYYEHSQRNSEEEQNSTPKIHFFKRSWKLRINMKISTENKVGKNISESRTRQKDGKLREKVRTLKKSSRKFNM